MESDRELLELAAKAAGIDVLHIAADGQLLIDYHGVGTRVWNPLIRDDDALRLAVKLYLSIQFGYCVEDSPVVSVYEQGSIVPRVQIGMAPDFLAATRRAIVRAAAAIAKGSDHAY